MKDFLTETDIKTIHQILVERYGGIVNIRDQNGITSATYRPQYGYYADIIEEAAALLESLLINHPFADGNKRTAFAAADVFLRINGHKIIGQPEQLYIKMIGWIDKESNRRFEQIAGDLRLIAVKL